MIVKLNKLQLNGYRLLFYKVKSVFAYFTYSFKAKKLATDSHYLDKYFYHKFPALKTDLNGQILCVSCKLCEKVCPTSALKIEKPGLIQMPQSLTTGEVPSHFILDKNQCIKCHICADVCVVDALSLSAQYMDQSQTVDLVEIINRESKLKKDPAESNSQN